MTYMFFFDWINEIPDRRNLRTLQGTSIGVSIIVIISEIIYLVTIDKNLTEYTASPLNQHKFVSVDKGSLFPFPWRSYHPGDET